MENITRDEIDALIQKAFLSVDGFCFCCGCSSSSAVTPCEALDRVGKIFHEGGEYSALAEGILLLHILMKEEGKNENKVFISLQYLMHPFALLSAYGKHIVDVFCNDPQNSKKVQVALKRLEKNLEDARHGRQ